MCLERMFCDCLLVCFKLIWNMSGLKLGEGGLHIYPRGTSSMLKNKPSWLPARNVWAEWILWDCVHNTPEGVTKIGALRSLSRSSHFLWVFCHHLRFNRGIGFSHEVVNWGKWILITLVTRVAFDAAWLFKRTTSKCRTYTPRSCKF